jgi:hypothetical protein
MVAAICGTAGSSSAQAGSEPIPLAPRSGPFTASSGNAARPGGTAGEDLRVDHLSGFAVLGREPVIGQVQVDAGRLDRGVAGLGLHRLQRHPGLPQPGQASVPKLMAGRVVQASSPPRRSQDLIHPLGRQRLPAPRALEDHKDPAGPGTGRPLGIQVRSRRGEEPCRDRHDPLMPALALADEHPPLPDVQIFQTQSEDLAAAQPTQHRREHHRPVPLLRNAASSASTSPGMRTRGRVRVERTSGTPCRGRCRSRLVGKPRGTGLTATSPRACR